ncbi:MAG: formimidoylglutamase, partial [Phycisphaerales bacterium]|nr:formimidoylglutamase [Phycisphaerales bacterium]
KKCRVALLGIPDDTGVELNHGRPGAVQGPAAFRQALIRYGAASPADHALDDPRPAYPRLFDAGDVVPAKTLAETHDRITAATAKLVDLGLFPIAIGGGHDCTFPFVRAVAHKFGPLTGVYLDAHLDVRPEPGSGMSFHALTQGGFARRLICVGLDPLSNTREHLDYFHSVNGQALTPAQFDPRRWPDDAHQFLSLDLDVLDMAFAPGVSAMNPCGLSPAQVGDYVEAAGRSPHVRCFDIMELSPPHDENGRTARLAAHMLLRFLRGFAARD